MDGGDKILMAAGCFGAFCVGAYVLWGGNVGTSRLRQRRGQIAGLYNFGKTCFLNGLLQALAACPNFIAWLQLNQKTDDKRSLISSLINTLEVINGTHITIRGDPYSPGAVIRALNNLGWVIPVDEQDSHELLHVILSSVEEEATKPKIPLAGGGLGDAIGLDDGGVASEINARRMTASASKVERPSSAMMSEFCNSDYGESVMRQTRSEVHTPDSPNSICSEADEGSNSILDATIEGSNLLRASHSRIRTISQRDEEEILLPKSSLFNAKKNSLSLERLNKGPGKVSVFSDCLKVQVHPFRGAISSQLVCSVCNKKSVVRYDKFDSITLPLSQNELMNPGLSLGHLLGEFCASETVNDVKCDTCEENTVHSKSTTFTKLPACLCIHISRNIWLSTGQAYKRQDFVHFPESLSMAPYSFVQPGLSSRMNTPWGSTMSLLSNVMTPDASINSTFGTMFPRNLYRLLAVVVHTGNASTGHFVTYRRGAFRNSHRWFYTSDTIVRETTIEEVLSKSAYLLFYDRGGNTSHK